MRYVLHFGLRLASFCRELLLLYSTVNRVPHCLNNAAKECHIVAAKECHIVAAKECHIVLHKAAFPAVHSRRVPHRLQLLLCKVNGLCFTQVVQKLAFCFL